MIERRDTLLLASGLSVQNPNSFSRQLQLLKHFLEEYGLRVLLAGRTPYGETSTDTPQILSGEGFDVPDFSKDVVEELSSRFEIARIILIGYPDQFPFLREGFEVPVYFWYQSSKPSIPPGLESTSVVPLTKMSADHLSTAGFPRIKPVIPHGVDIKTFFPARDNENSGARQGPVLLCLGANSQRKRFDILIEAFRLVTDRIPGAKLIIKTDDEDKPGGFNLKQLTHRHAVSSRVTIITTELADPDLASLYCSSDIFIHTAEWEGFCIPIIEAMASGLPVVTHPVQGPGELVPYTDLLVGGSRIIKDGEVVLMEADPRAFAEMVVNFAYNPALSQRAAAAGRAAAVSRFDINIVAKQWFRLLFQP
jgi:glycosyltransferase involved in cell wall biosynthesis